MSTVPTGPNTYGVANTSITRKSTSSKMVGFATGHVDAGSGPGRPSVVSLTAGASGDTAGNTVFGAAYMHLRYYDNEPYHFGFAFEDDFSNQPNSAVPVYYLRTHSTASHMNFSLSHSDATTQNVPYTLVFFEVQT